MVIIVLVRLCLAVRLNCVKGLVQCLANVKCSELLVVIIIIYVTLTSHDAMRKRREIH